MRGADNDMKSPRYEVSLAVAPGCHIDRLRLRGYTADGILREMTLGPRDWRVEAGRLRVIDYKGIAEVTAIVELGWVETTREAPDEQRGK